MATEPKVSARRVASVSPATGQVLREFECATADDVSRAVQEAAEAQVKWAGLAVRERSAILRRFQRGLHAAKEEVAAVIARETGKPAAEALTTEVLVALDAAGFYAREALRVMRPQRIQHANPAMKLKKSRLLREPYGVIGIISPWNYPFSIPASEAMAALVTGNAVVLKPSEFTSLCALRLRELMMEAGVPGGVFQVMVGDGITGDALVRSPINKLIFTGSVSTGRRIAATAAERLLPVVLELGGKDAMLVLRDADLEVASSAAVWGAFMNAGQTCLSVERCYVDRAIHADFVRLCVEKTGRLKVGHDAGSDVGGLIHLRQLEQVEKHVREAVAQGAKLEAGGMRLPTLGATCYAPTILTEVRGEMRIMREETFGPVLPIMAVADEEEAVARANDSEFGLAASIWTTDKARGERLASRLQAGTVMVNDVISCFGMSEAPHGGFKQSGLGRTHGRLGLEEMTQVKFISSDAMPKRPKVWWFPYGSAYRAQMDGFINGLFAAGVGKRLRGMIRAMPLLARLRRRPR